MQAAKEVSLLAKYRKDRVFSGTTLFQTYAERLVRKHVLLQFSVGQGHNVFEEEQQLVRQSTDDIRRYLSKARIRGGIPWATVKTVVSQYIHHAAAERLKEEDLNPDVEKAVLESVRGEELEGLFPASWLDS